LLVASFSHISMNDECLFNQQEGDNSSLIVRNLPPCSVEKAKQMLTANGVAILSFDEIKKYFQ